MLTILPLPGEPGGGCPTAGRPIGGRARGRGRHRPRRSAGGVPPSPDPHPAPRPRGVRALPAVRPAKRACPGRADGRADRHAARLCRRHGRRDRPARGGGHRRLRPGHAGAVQRHRPAVHHAGAAVARHARGRGVQPVPAVGSGPEGRPRHPQRSRMHRGGGARRDGPHVHDRRPAPGRGRRACSRRSAIGSPPPAPCAPPISSRPSRPSATCGTAASARARSWWSRTSRKAAAACATCRPCTG